MNGALPRRTARECISFVFPAAGTKPGSSPAFSVLLPACGGEKLLPFDAAGCKTGSQVLLDAHKEDDHRDDAHKEDDHRDRRQQRGSEHVLPLDHVEGF